MMMQYHKLDSTVRIIDGEGDIFDVMCVESGAGCDGCEFKRAPGKSQEPFCRATACGSYERIDGKDVIYQRVKVKGGEE